MAGESKVKELIATLDMRKNEAIERTFKQVAKNFRDIFSELAPGSKGELVMIKVRGPKVKVHGRPNHAISESIAFSDAIRNRKSKAPLYL